MKKITLLLILSIAIAMAAMAQPYQVKFTAVDSLGEGEPYATVRIYRAADTTKVVATDVTGLNGDFSHTLDAAGSYLLRLAAVGKQSFSREFAVTRQQPVANLGTITLGTDAHMLQGVTVTAQAPLITTEIDRVSYDVQNDDDSKTRTTFDMLRKVPMVSVDGQENIQVKGSSSFKIYKNGHPDPSISQNPKDVLKSIPASMIKKIEVITEPGAKYDAEGVGAILNIVTVDGTAFKGVSGTVSESFNQLGGNNLNTYITSQVGKFITSVNYGWYRTGKREGRNRSESLSHYTASGNDLHSYTDGRASDVNVHYGNIQASYEPDTLNLLTISASGHSFAFDGEVGTSSLQMTNGGNLLYGYDSRVNSAQSRYSIDGSFDYEHKTRRKGEALTLSYMLDASHSKNNTGLAYENMVNMPVPYKGLLSHGTTDFLENTFQLDWTRPFLAHNKVETGLKYIHRNNKSHNVSTYDGAESLDRDMRFRHLTQVGAAYLSYTYNLKSFSARAGLRYEWSQISGKYPGGEQPNFSSDLSDWVPSASISYKIGWKHTFKAAFATRILRPGIDVLNPYRNESPESVSYGNPDLVSTRNYAYSLNYMLVTPKLTLSLSPSYDYQNNGVSANNWVGDDGRVYSSYTNNQRYRRSSLSTYVQWSPFTGTSIMVNNTLTYAKVKDPNVGLSNSGWSIFSFANITQQLPWKLRLTLGGGEWKSGVSDVYHRPSRAQWWHYASLQRSFLKDDRLTVRVSADQPFGGKWSKYTSRTWQGDVTGLSTSWWVNRKFTLSVSYRFGSLKASVKSVDKSIVNDDLQQSSGSQQGGQGQGGGR